MSSPTTEDKKQDHTGHEATIIINGRSAIVSVKELTFDEVVELSGLAVGPEVVFTISYRKGDGKKPEGSMVRGGEPVKIKDGMIFNVDSTNRS